ncbi:MAG: NifB/NifX family molybdenum-iron cluster-binding protein [Syntrophales bacterium]|nr:NifB/NifX family molybdenum-iron cluster-binding protein [Syntrophales bacterium]MDY0043685.1 NifB/NifX family molybdenum-iron cluster-binding protein [Syntrophales bacterium]
MKLAVTSTGKDLSSKVDKSFGRAKWFVVIDTSTGAVEAHSNAQNVDASHGAGIQAAQNIARIGAEAVLTGNVGPNAFRTLEAASIKIYLFGNNAETVEDALSLWKEGSLKEVNAPTREGHWV